MNVNEIDYRDRGEFLRGFATIIRKNNCRHSGERAMFLTIGKYLGFEKEFCENAIEQLMINNHISESPAIFSNISAAEFFIKDVTNIMLHMNSMSDDAKEWLRETAEANKIDFNP